MTQLSFCGVLFNLLLALYFLQTVAKGWREHQFMEIRRYIYSVVVLVGLGLALGGIPFYEPMFYACTVPIPPFADSWIPIVFFFFLPFGLSLIVILLATASLFLSVYKLEKSSSRWRLQETGDSMTVKVFWRCFFYLLAFCVPWPMYFASYFVELTESNYPFFVALQICIPCQGILNFLVYRYRSGSFSSIQPSISANKPSRHILQSQESESIGRSLTQSCEKRDGLSSSFQRSDGLSSSFQRVTMAGRTMNHSHDSIDEDVEEF